MVGVVAEGYDARIEDVMRVEFVQVIKVLPPSP